VQLGSGSRHILLVGGLHAGFAPGTVELAQAVLRYFETHPEQIPTDSTLHIITNLNPDSPDAPGKLAGRLNANGVDLNRNWDCDWQSNAVWGKQAVSGGAEPFSEPETVALRNYIAQINPIVVLFWQARIENGMISAGGCGSRSLVSEEFAQLYGETTGYTVAPFDRYVVNGDAVNSLDAQGIPAFSVLLPSYTEVDTSNHLPAIRDLLNYR